ncbi:VOC family protein [Streptomyces sp. SKN60]|uniref:VOC family protein n=1 Tax=Streptomyces sp. SKN60 TaxID=2855506 RepID=UPI002245DA2B|nr:VOC family protein [Streptomyces sp. SKN60]MCX2185790.1 VOC family protein [Streptomyces sp. SKN60]
MDAIISGVRHIKIFVTDLARSAQWYERVFDLRLELSFQDDDGVVRGMQFGLPGTDLKIALREHPAWVNYDADPFALATTREALDAWDVRLGELGIPRTPVLRASGGHGLGFRDPDGMQIRLYAPDETVAAETVVQGTVISSSNPVDPSTLLR